MRINFRMNTVKFVKHNRGNSVSDLHLIAPTPGDIRARNRSTGVRAMAKRETERRRTVSKRRKDDSALDASLVLRTHATAQVPRA